MTPDRDTDTTTCGHDWCTARHVHCPYSGMHPHRAEGGRYATDDRGDDTPVAAP